MPLVYRGEKGINERYRPMRLSEMIGNDSNKIGLKAWMESGKSRSRSLLLAGSSSGGKTTTARILAMGLNCEKGDTTEPCLECDSCKAALEGTAFHIIEHNMSEANTKEDAAAIVDSMYELCMTGRNKVYILDEVQKLTNSSQNLFLKTVENPPPGVYIIFCTTEEDKLISPLRNRCECYRYHLPTSKEIASLLGEVTKLEKLELTDEQKKEFFRNSQGKAYREILHDLMQFKAGIEFSKMGGPMSDEERIEEFEIAKAVFYKGDFKIYQKALENGQNIEYEKLRCILRSFAASKIEKCGFSEIKEAAFYYDLLMDIEERKFFESNNRPLGSALLWKICMEVQDHKG